MKRVLVTGGEGQLARALVAVRPAGVSLWAPRRSVVDIADDDSLVRGIEGFAPDLIINAAAYTAVDRAETDEDTADRVNRRAVERIGLLCAEKGVRVLHVSTDYVFGGNADRPYEADHPPRPTNVYGRTKAAGEAALIASGAQCNIVRTSWLFAPWGSNFLTSMVARMRSGESLRVVSDQIGAPSSALELAEALWVIGDVAPEKTVLHWSNSGQASYYEFAVAIAERLRSAGQISAEPAIEAVSSGEYAAPAPRPAYSVLNCQPTFDLTGSRALDWQDALGKVMEKMS